jgi:hypothetical protein
MLYIVGSIMLALVISNASYSQCGTSAYSNVNPKISLGLTPHATTNLSSSNNNNNNETNNEDSNAIDSLQENEMGVHLADLKYGAWEDVFSDYDAFTARLMTETELKEAFYSSVYEGNTWPWYQDKQALFEVCTLRLFMFLLCCI